MTLGSYLRLVAPLAALVGWAGTSAAADQALPVYAAPTLSPGVGAPAIDCPTCHGGGAPAGCATCGKGHLGVFHKHCRVFYVPHLCPGACFGYFQTQWHRWENVCPIPYQGAGLSDAPPPVVATPPAPTIPTDKKPGELKSPTPVPGAPPAPMPGVPPAPMPG